ncbi:unnamed protein product [Brassica oleracea var. botrytis]|uniref:BnaC03g65000D protein n=2 Tax=Brassica napus TaxID=3708 RepID=A0A078HXV6_BRANA|nr:hypothetical protein HID58_056940 [Brassica napus]CAF1711211.1 unnamed protein product [Brassica napus]CDY42179.1 BnaC03g65000D [Brassica napus]
MKRRKIRGSLYLCLRQRQRYLSVQSWPLTPPYPPRFTRRRFQILLPSLPPSPLPPRPPPRSNPRWNHKTNLPSRSSLSPQCHAAVSADHYSFPSGDTSRVFFVAASDHGGVKGEVLVAVWVWATVTAVSRILLGRHYVLDVAAFLGVLEALFALRFLRLEHILL